MRKWEEALDLVLPHLRDCPAPMARLQIITAARQFCERSGALRLTIDPTPTIAQIPDYDVEILRHASVLKVTQAQIDGKTLEPLQASDYDTRVAYRNEPGTPQWLIFRDSLLTLYPTPATDGMLVTATITAMPTYRSKGLQTDFWNRHVDAIAIGARSLLMSAKDKPYSDPNEAANLMAEFRALAGVANYQTESSFADAPIHVTGYYE